MTVIKPGPELDRAVAEAVDPLCTVAMCVADGCRDAPPDTEGDVLAVWKWNGERTYILLPKFSTDLNAAFAAAEKVGLFRKQCCLLQDTYWHVWGRFTGRTLGPEFNERGETPALAICAAILKLKENQ